MDLTAYMSWRRTFWFFCSESTPSMTSTMKERKSGTLGTYSEVQPRKWYCSTVWEIPSWTGRGVVKGVPYSYR